VSLFNSILGINNRPAHVVPTVGAGDVRGGRRAALGAGLELLGGQSMVRATLAGARIRMFTLGDSHNRAPEYCLILGETESRSVAGAGQGGKGGGNDE